MQIFFHIGPPKTGTTSLQNFLSKTLGSAEPKPIWYPALEEDSFCHGSLAKLLLVKGNGSSDILRDIVRRAEQAGVEKLVLSSEVFSAITDTMSDCRDAMAGHDVTLVSTQNSLVLRAASRWQEWLKGRYARKLEHSTDMILESPGYQVDLLERFAVGLNVKDVVIIYSSPKDAASLLIERTSELLGISCKDYLDEAKNIRLNPKMGFIEAEMLRRLNELLAEHSPKTSRADFVKLRNSLLAAFKSPNWRDVNPYVEIKNPKALTEAVIARAHEIEKSIETLRWPLREIGDRTALFAVGQEPKA